MDYSKTKIYKIWSLKGDKIYVGATTKDLLCQRMSKHRSMYSSWLKGKGKNITSYLIFEEYGVDNCQIELLEMVECKNRDEQKQKEGHYIRTLECVNKVITNRIKSEYDKEFRETHKDAIKEYNEVNKDKINEQRRNNRIKNKEKIKEHREANKDEINDKNRQYRQANRDTLNEKRRLQRAEAKKQTN